MMEDLDRRRFLKTVSVAGTGLALGAAGAVGRDQEREASPLAGRPLDVVRVGFVGIGKRGRYLIKPLMGIEGVEVRAVCDILEDRTALAQKTAENLGKPRPDGYHGGPEVFRDMCERDDLDLVINAAPWKWHVPICLAAMDGGKHTFTEVPAATTIDGCWALVEKSEKTGLHCVMMENCCYFRNALLVLNMVRKGILGEMLHCEAGYQHYRISDNVFSNDGKLLWCGEEEEKRDGNLYPTHAVGPVGQWLNINRGDRFDYLVSISGKSRGLNIYAEEHFGEDHPLVKKKYALGDINTTIIKTVNGCTVTLYHDTQAPRPYDLIYRAQGTKGLYMGTLDKFHIKGRSPDHKWEDSRKYYEEFEHPLWRAHAEKAKGQGHGGADYVMLRRLIQCLKDGVPPDMDVYDAADWSVISELSERSVAKRGRTQDFPDFTRGKWRQREELGIATG